MVKTWARSNTAETLLNNGWRLAAVGSSWWLVVPQGCPLVLSFTKKIIVLFKDTAVGDCLELTDSQNEER